MESYTLSIFFKESREHNLLPEFLKISRKYVKQEKVKIKWKEKEIRKKIKYRIKVIKLFVYIF